MEQRPKRGRPPTPELLKGKPRPAPSVYVAQWKAEADQVQNITGDSFKFLRKSILGMTQVECAAFLRVHQTTITDWEHGYFRVPFSAYYMLVMVSKTPNFRFANEQWAGWKIEAGYDPLNKFEPISYLKNDKLRISLEPNELLYVRQWLSLGAAAREQVVELRSALDAAIAENTRLRQMFRENGVTAEIEAMQNKITALLDGIRTAKILDLSAYIKPSNKEAAA
jgi:DNA-binding transcriptional regulator YiaG